MTEYEIGLKSNEVDFRNYCFAILRLSNRKARIIPLPMKVEAAL